ncbi:MAG: MFS transporter, partial [Gemmataceae bacterium]
MHEYDHATDSRSEGPPDPASGVRYRVLGMLSLLSFILYLDRICIAQAVPAMEADLGISHTAMGLVLGAFTVAYGLFEVPTGHWGDRYGSRGVLTRIVLWWSAFTMLTGAATGLIMLLIVRFLFGAGEAGALPNSARVVARWFPAPTRGWAQGVVIASALVGGAISPMVAESLIQTLGWRWAFAVLGFPGVLWAVVFYRWFRDDPAKHVAVNEAECRLIGAHASSELHEHPPVPWRLVLRSANIWLLGAVITCAAFTTYMFFSWYPTYLQDGRGV